MDIKLNTLFNNPRLPYVPRPGFRDDFDRTAEQGLGVTLDGKIWEYSSSAWDIVEPGHASGAGRGNLAYVDGLSADGTLTAVVGRASDGSGDGDWRSGIAFRATDGANFIGIWPNTSGVLTLYARSDGSTVTSRTLDATLADGDTLSATFVGSAITAHLNGVEIYSGTVTLWQDITRHGFTNFASAANGTWDSIEFTPA